MLVISPRSQRRGLYLTGLVCLIGSGGMCFWGWMPLASEGHKPKGREPSVPTAARLTQSPALQEFADLASVRLRRPLVDPPPPIKKPVRKPAPPVRRSPKAPRLDIRLVGTVLEQGKSTAILVDSQGQIRVGREGESWKVGSATIRVDTVTREAAVISKDEQTVRLELPRTESLR